MKDREDILMIVTIAIVVILMLHSVIFGANYLPWLNYKLSKIFEVPK